MKVASFSSAPRFLRMQFPRVCTVVIAHDPADLIDKLEQVGRDNPFIEIRLDYLSKPALVLTKLKQFFATHRDLITIATCRRVANGGHFRGSVASQYDLLLKAAQNGFRLLDVELETAEALKPQEFEKLRNALMMHYHLRDKTAEVIGEAATREAIAEIVANIRKRLGKQLGGDSSG